MKRTIFIFLVLLVVLGFIAWVYFDNKATNETIKQNETIIEGIKKSVNWEDVPANITVPGVGDQVAANVAAPDLVGSAGNNTTAKQREFNIQVSGSEFSPNTIIVKLKDQVRIYFTASGGNYDFTQPDYGLKVSLPAGKEVPVQFEAGSLGKFRFFCESCGGPDKGPVGYIIVTE